MNDALIQKVELLDVNPTYTHIKYSDDHESIVSLQELAPCPLQIHERGENGN